MNVIVEIINAAGQRFVAFALPMLIQSGVLILMLLVLNLALRRKVRAIFRYWIWMLVLVKLVLPPSLGSPISIGTWFGDKLEVSTTNLFEAEEPLTTQAPAIVDSIVSRPVPIFVAPAAPVTETPARHPMSPIDGTAVEASPPTSRIKEVVSAKQPAATLTWQGLVLLFWSAAVAALLLLLLQRAFFVQGLVAQADEPNRVLLNALEECRDRIALRGPIALKVSPNASSPAVCGLVNPVILIPHNLAPKLHGRDLRAVLLHELAHVKRGDLWVNLVQTLLQIVYFYNPLLWVANAAIRRVREQAVDETVLVAMGETAPQYPETLIHVAKLAFRRRPVLSLRLIGVVESKSALSGRIKHILNRPIPKTARLGLLGLLVVVLVAVVMLPMAKARPMTDRARDVLALAEEQARAFNHRYLGTEHILVALSRRSDAVSAKVLDNLGVNADALRAQMRAFIKAGSEPSPAGKLPQTARARQALARAADEARALGHDYIGTEHLLLALAKDGQSVAVRMLHGLGLTAPQVRAETLKLVRPGRVDASAADTEDRASSPFVTILPNGVTVELLGVCEHPSQGKAWWRPDGSPLEEVPYDRIDGKASPDENEAAFEFAVRVLKLPEGAETRMAAEPATSAGGGSSPAFKGGWQLDELRWLVAEFGADVQTCTIRVGVATEPWQTVVRSSGREAVVEWTGRGSIEFSKARQDPERGVCITVTDHMLDQTSRVVAVTTEGRLERPWRSGASSSGGVRETRVDFPELSLADVSEFLFQTRAWTWAEFADVSLRPGPGRNVRDRAAPKGDRPTTGPATPLPSTDTDGDGLSDFQEVHKYLTDPAKKDSDGDGTPDGDWNERREYAYSVRTVLRFMPPFDEDGLNDDFQDARVLKQTDDYIEIEVIHYPLATSHESIPENPNWRKDYAHMSEYLAPGVTTNWDEPMKRDLLAALKADGIDVETLTDKQVIEQVSRWLMKRSRSLDKVFTTFYVYCPDGRPEVYPGLKEAFQNEFNRDSANYDWSIEEHFDHELLGKGMFYNQTHGSCTSVAVYLTTVLRALGIPTRMVLVTPAVDASDRAQILKVKNAITHNRVRLTMLAGLGRSSHGWTNHTFNEVYVGNRWCRLDYTQLGCGVLGLRRFGLQTHVYTFNDLSDVNFAPTWGWRYAKGEHNDTFQHDNPYSAVEVSEQFGAHGNIPNPPFTAQDLASHPEPDIFLFHPSGVSVWSEFVELVSAGTANKTGRPHQKEFYDNLFEGIWLTRPQDILVLLFSLDTPERVPQEYEDLLPKPWPEIESLLKQGRTVELSGKARDMNVILLAAPTKDELKPLVRNSKLLSALGTSTKRQGNPPSGRVPPPPSSPFAARVNDDVEIELLGICDHPSEGGQWWCPDGSLMKTAPYRATGSRLEHEEGRKDYEFALRLSGPRDTTIAWIVSGSSRGSNPGRALDEAGDHLPETYAYLANQQEDARVANVFIGVAAGAWETCAVHKMLDSEGSYTLEDDKAVAFGIAYAKGNDTFVPVTTNIKSREINYRVVAVDVNDEHHVAVSGSGYGGNVLHSGTCRFEVPLRQVKELRFQRRPYTWVGYTPVSLRPEQATDVTIKLLDTEAAATASQRAPGQEMVWGIGPAWEALRDRAGKRYGGTIGGFSMDDKRCREYLAQVLSWTAFDDTFVLMFAFDRPVAIPPLYADLLPLPWPEVESRVEQGEPVEAQGRARNLNVVLLAAPTSEQLNALVQQTHLLDAFRTGALKEPESAERATPDRRRLYLPDLETPDADTVLDLATGQLLSAAPMEKDSQYFGKLGKGDIVYEYASDKSGLLCLRSARILTKSILLSGAWSRTDVAQPDVQRPGFVVYFIGQVPCRYLIETAEGDHYELNIISIDKGDSGGALVEFAKAGETRSGSMEVTKKESFSVYGTVKDQSGRPMPGVEVTAHCGFATLMPTGRAVTDEAGRYTLHFGPGFRNPGVYPGDVRVQAATIHARKSGFYEASLCRQGNLAMAGKMPGGEDQQRIARYAGVVLPNKPCELDFVMRPAARIEGELVDAQDKPLPARTLALDGDELYPSTSALASIETDRDGTFVVESVPLKSFWFEYGRQTRVKSSGIHFTMPGTWRIELTYDDSRPGNPELAITAVQKPGADSPGTAAELPSGVTARLLGLCTISTTAPSQWWYPDGVVMSAERSAPFKKYTELYVAAQGFDGPPAYAYLLQFEGGEDLTARSSVDVGSQWLWSGSRGDSPYTCAGYVWYDQTQNERGLPTTADVKVAAAVGPYSTLEAEFDDVQGNAAHLVAVQASGVRLRYGNDQFLVSIPWRFLRRAGMTTVDVTVERDDIDVRLRYQETDGSVRTAERERFDRPLVPLADGRSSPLTTHRFMIRTKPELIKRILLDYRRASVAVFKNVSLHPGRKTHTEVEMRGVAPATGPLDRYALSFDGVDDCVIVPASPSLALKSPFTIEMWFRADPNAELYPQMSLMQKGRKPDDPNRVQAGGFLLIGGRTSKGDVPGGGSLYVGQADGGLSQIEIVLSPPLERPGWAHLCARYAGKDYVPVADQPLLIGDDFVPDSLRLRGQCLPFKGEIAEVRIWNRALTDAEVQWYRAAPLTGNEPNLVACWTFEEGHGRIVRDISPNANHAQLGNSTEADDADPKWVRMGP